MTTKDKKKRSAEGQRLLKYERVLQNGLPRAFDAD